jgi:hypothetical protein
MPGDQEDRAQASVARFIEYGAFVALDCWHGIKFKKLSAGEIQKHRHLRTY